MTDGARRRLLVTARAERDFKQLPQRDRARIRTALDGLTTRSPSGDVKKLHGVDDE